MIRHEIDTEMELNGVKIRGYKDTISSLKRKLDEMESIVQHLGGDVGVDDVIELSD